MSFGTIIKKLRRERDLTQEQLAELLSISPQAVSRWENNIAMPDISLLPTLCNLFTITSDELLGIDIEKKKEKIGAISEKASDYSSRGYYDKAREILEGGLREYPDSYRLMYSLMHLSYWQSNDDLEQKAYLDEAISLGEAILTGCTDDELRHGAVQILCYLYSYNGNREKARKLAMSMPCIAVSQEMLLSIINTGDERYQAKQTEAVKLFEFLSNSIVSMQTKLDSGEYAYTESELAALRDKRIAFLHLFFEDGDFGFYHCHLCDTHTEQAVYYAKNGDLENAISHLRAAARHAIGFVTANDSKEYTSLVFRGKARGGWTGGSTDNDAAELMKKLDSAAFDNFRGTPEFEAVKRN